MRAYAYHSYMCYAYVYESIHARKILIDRARSRSIKLIYINIIYILLQLILRMRMQFSSPRLAAAAYIRTRTRSLRFISVHVPVDVGSLSISRWRSATAAVTTLMALPHAPPTNPAVRRAWSAAPPTRACAMPHTQCIPEKK